MAIGLILIAIGIIALLIKLGLLAGSVWGYAGPVILIILGVAFLWGVRSRCHWFGWCKQWCFPSGREEKE